MLLSDSHLNQPSSYPHSDLKISKCHTPIARGAGYVTAGRPAGDLWSCDDE
jgi:hypothetical protein